MANKNYKIKQVLNDPKIILNVQLGMAKDFYNDIVLTMSWQ